MKKLITVGIIVLFVGAGVIPSTATMIKKTSSTAIGSPGYIQDLIDNASDGDTIYIPSGIYYENIVIDKSINLIGEDRNTTIINGGRIQEIVAVYADWVNISEFTIQNGFYGVYINSDNNTISSNKILNCYFGILLHSSQEYNNIIGNTLSFNNDGIYMEFNHNTIITKNKVCFNNQIGVCIFRSHSTTVSYNNISSNKNTGSYSSKGGIKIHDCVKCFILNNIITCNYENGIDYSHDWTGSVEDVISGNIISRNKKNGIKFSDAWKNIIIKNTITFNDNNGIVIPGDNNIISGNLITDNNYSGIQILGNTNSISKNTISNHYYGINIQNSYKNHDNIIFKNNFIDNEVNAFDDNTENFWYNEKTKKGNYWSDYKENYPDAKKLWLRGIWDTPYDIEGGDNKDEYPLINQRGRSRTRATPRTATIDFPLFHLFFERFPNILPVLRYLLG